MTSTEHPGRTLRTAMKTGVVAVPGSFNALVARAVADAGFQATYISDHTVMEAEKFLESAKWHEKSRGSEPCSMACMLQVGP